MDTALSAFTVDTSQPGTTRVSGRLHHALCDVTGILSIVDHEHDITDSAFAAVCRTGGFVDGWDQFDHRRLTSTVRP